MKEDFIIIGIHVLDRMQCISKVQEILTKYGCDVKTRLGLHKTNEQNCSKSGLIILEFIGSKQRLEEMVESLLKIESVKIQKMIFVAD
jgi:uncharacterized protein (DUF1330 family)